ncbi:hypothetical protein CU044_3605 [Streptomyces sp. L-9-10]|nr:hypothetical protein CU044_3605 [Streptomyces sp. L-9-10]
MSTDVVMARPGGTDRVGPRPEAAERGVAPRYADFVTAPSRSRPDHPA